MNELTKENLVKYIECVKKLETSLYSQKRALKKMTDEAAKCKRDSVQKQISYECERWVGTDKSTAEIVWGRILSGAGIGLLCGFFFALLGADMGGSAILGIIIGGMIGIGWGVTTVKETHENDLMEKTMEANRVKRANERIDAQNEENKKFAIAAEHRKNIVDAEIEFLKNNIEAMTEQLNGYYNLDVVYPKYRGMVYVCSIYEYLASGRCETLTGPYGAYNMLENDIKYARVLEKMENIVSNLEQIKENQMEIYYAIRETNNQLAELDASIKGVAAKIETGNQNVEDLKESLNNIEYNSKISAESEQFTAMYHFFKN